MDVHRDTVVATGSGVGVSIETRTYTTYTNDLYKLREWLLSVGVTHLAMESPGIYWKPICNILEDDFEVILINASHVKNIPGHKTDKKDSHWLAKLLLSGLLKASFIPCKVIRNLRDLTRYRKKLVRQATADRNRLERILQDANFKISNVITDIFGISGMKLIDALLNDTTDFDTLYQLCHGRIQKKKDILRESLMGKLTVHHKYMLTTIRQNLYAMMSKIDMIDAQIQV